MSVKVVILFLILGFVHAEQETQEKSDFIRSNGLKRVLREVEFPEESNQQLHDISPKFRQKFQDIKNRYQNDVEFRQRLQNMKEMYENNDQEIMEPDMLNEADFISTLLNIGRKLWTRWFGDEELPEELKQQLHDVSPKLSQKLQNMKKMYQINDQEIFDPEMKDDFWWEILSVGANVIDGLIDIFWPKEQSHEPETSPTDDRLMDAASLPTEEQALKLIAELKQLEKKGGSMKQAIKLIKRESSNKKGDTESLPTEEQALKLIAELKQLEKKGGSMKQAIKLIKRESLNKKGDKQVGYLNKYY